MANSVVFGIFSSKQQMDTAVDQMKRDGFRNADISVVFPLSASKGGRSGAISGAIIGGALGWLAGIGLAFPGLGQFFAAGSITTTFGGAFVGASAGGIIGALIGINIPEFPEGRIKGGCILLSVHAHDAGWTAKAKTILEAAGADDIASSGESKRAEPAEGAAAQEGPHEDPHRLRTDLRLSPADPDDPDLECALYARFRYRHSRPRYR